jgi:hypothetical protein
MDIELLNHVGNIIHLAAYIVTDVMWLRVLAIVGNAVFLVYTFQLPDWRASWIIWNMFYNVVNVVQIVRLLQARRPVRLEPEEESLYALAFRALTPREFRKLLSIARWHDAPAGACLVAQGAQVSSMLVLVRGQVAVKVDGRAVATLGAGRFVGEMGFLTGRPTTAAVEATEPVRYVAWPAAELARFLDKQPDLRSMIQLLIGKDLVAKLAPARAA